MQSNKTDRLSPPVYARICDGRQIVGHKTKRYGTGTRIKHPYNRILTVTVRSPTDMVADIFTKSLPAILFQRHRDSLGLLTA